MTKFCYYISDHGWGHAARSIAIIRELLKSDKEIKILIKADYALQFLQDSLIANSKIKFDRCRNDFGFDLKNDRLKVDREKTRKRLEAWLTTWVGFIEREKSYCKSHKVDLIISNIAPQPFIVANSLNIPGIAISNFTWYGIYSRPFGENENVTQIKDAYRKAHLGLVLPMAESNLPFPKQIKVGLVARETTLEPEEVRKKLGITFRKKWFM